MHSVESFSPAIAIAEALTYTEIEDGVHIKENLDGSKTLMLSAMPEQRQRTQSMRTALQTEEDGTSEDAQTSEEQPVESHINSQYTKTRRSSPSVRRT